MNGPQKVWWEQVQSDHRLFVLLRDRGVEPCHLLHYLQMTTEKLGKAYLWRSGKPPPKVHTGFVACLRALASLREPDIGRIVRVFGFARADDFDNWVTSVLPLAYRVQNLAPPEANDGPNPEYPWPHHNPVYTPAGYSFALWTDLTETGQGKRFVEFVRDAVASFDAYA